MVRDLPILNLDQDVDIDTLDYSAEDETAVCMNAPLSKTRQVYFPSGATTGGGNDEDAFDMMYNKCNKFANAILPCLLQKTKNGQTNLTNLVFTISEEDKNLLYKCTFVLARDIDLESHKKYEDPRSCTRIAVDLLKSIVAEETLVKEAFATVYGNEVLY